MVEFFALRDWVHDGIFFGTIHNISHHAPKKKHGQDAYPHSVPTEDRSSKREERSRLCRSKRTSRKVSAVETQSNVGKEHCAVRWYRDESATEP